MAGPRRPVEVPEALDLVLRNRARSVILVEGWSDQAAVEAWARTCGVDLADSRIVVLPVGGITNLGKFASAFRAAELGVRPSGLYDASEEDETLRALERAGFGTALTRASAADAGFFACDRDLEDELIRALGADAVESLLQAQGEHESFRKFQQQPAQRARDRHSQLKRFMGTRAGRKVRYGSLLVSALAPDRAPLPLRRVLSHALA